MQNQSVTVVITGIKMSVKLLLLSLISNDKRTDWSPVQSVNTQVITKLYNHTAGVGFVYKHYDYRQYWTMQSLATN